MYQVKPALLALILALMSPLLLASEPAAPIEFSANFTYSAKQIELTWIDDSTDEDGFIIYRKGPNDTGFQEVETLDSGTQQFSDVNVDNNTTYQYRIVSYNGDGQSSPIESEITTPEGGPRTPYIGLGSTTGAVTTTSVAVMANSGSYFTTEAIFETEFVIERSLSGANDFSVAASSATLGLGYYYYFNDSGLQPDTTYTYRARAWNAWGETENTFDIKTNFIMNGGVGVSFAISNETGICGTVSWTVGDTPYWIAGIRILKDGSSISEPGFQANGIAYDWSAQHGIESTYTLELLAYNYLGYIDVVSSSSTTATPNLIPPALTNVTAVFSPAFTLANTGVYFTWDTVYWPNKVRIYREFAGEGYLQAGDVTDYSQQWFDNNNMTSNTTYRYALVCYNNFAGSEPIYLEVYVPPFESYIDSAPPLVVFNSPEMYTNSLRPTISVDLFDSGSGIDTGSLWFYVNGWQVTPDLVTGGFEYVPANELWEGQNYIAVSVLDNAGNYTSEGWVFYVDLTPPPPPLQTFSGQSYYGTGLFNMITPDSGASTIRIYRSDVGLIAELPADNIYLYYTFYDANVSHGVYYEYSATLYYDGIGESEALYSSFQIEGKTVQFSQTYSSGPEAVHTVDIAVELSFANEQETTVEYSVTGGTAVVGVDYENCGGTLTFAPYETVKYIQLLVLDDLVLEQYENVLISLTGTSANMGAQTTFEYGIVNDDCYVDVVPPIIFNVFPSVLSTTSNPNIFVGADYVDDDSGINVDSLSVEIDGQSMSVLAANDCFIFYPWDNWSHGVHTINVSIEDNAGNVGTQSWTFNVNVVDTVSPVISIVTPLANSVSNSIQPHIIATLADSGTGINPASIQLEFAPGFEILSATAQEISIVAATDLPFGTYSVQVTVADFAGNSTTKVWSFDVTGASGEGGFEFGPSPYDDLPLHQAINGNDPEGGEALGAGGIGQAPGAGGAGGDSDTGDAWMSAYSELGMAPKELSFSGNFDLSKDDVSKVYSAPHWLDTNTYEGMPEPSLNRNYPLAYSANTKLKVSGKFHNKWAMNVGTVWIRGVSTEGYDIPWTATTNDLVFYTLPETEATTAFTQDKIRYFESFEIRWEVLFSEGAPPLGSVGSEIGTTRHTVYVTQNVPTTPLRQWSLFHIGCFAADNETVSTAAFDKIYAEFTDRSVKQVGVDQPMRYQLPDSIGLSTNALLSNGFGTCKAWASMLRDIAKVQGIAGAEVLDLSPVENWQIPTVLVGFKPLFIVVKEMGAQNNPSPVRKFDGHSMVQYNGFLYDPSYGTAKIGGASENVRILSWQATNLVQILWHKESLVPPGKYVFRRGASLVLQLWMEVKRRIP